MENQTQENFKWSHRTTLLLLNLYKKYRKQVGTFKIKSLKKMFDEIGKEMEQLTGLNISGFNCENRWKVLERNYKKFVDNSNKTGRGRKVFEYSEEMKDILGVKKNIYPQRLLGSSTEHHLDENKENNVEDEGLQLPGPSQPDTSSSSSSQVQNTPKKYENKRLKNYILKEIRDDRRAYYKKKLHIEENILKEKIRKNDILEKRNRLLETQLLMSGELPDFN